LKKNFLIFLISILLNVSLFSGEWLLDGGSSVFLPEGWLIYDQTEPGRISFISPGSDVIFQVTSYPGASYHSDTTMMENHLSELNVIEKDVSRFPYQGRLCSMADLQILSGENEIRGWFLFVEREDRDYYLTAITGTADYEKNLPLILSCLDGFSPDDTARRTPGAISALTSSIDHSEHKKILTFRGKEVPFLWTTGRNESLRLLIEREASILSTYKNPDLFDEAWNRYYQLIYRDSRPDLSELASILDTNMEGMTKTKKAETLLSWLQNFQYGSTNLFSDLLTPIESLNTETGDCDALALVYVLLLNHMNIPAVLMVSRDYSHALGAVAVEREGAHFTMGNETYVVAEMTEKVALGQISSDMADLNHWVVIPFSDYDKGTLSFGNSH